MRVAVMISGRGSNLKSLIEASMREDYPAEIVGVLSDNGHADGLVMAHENNIPTSVVLMRDKADKANADATIERQLKAWNADLVCLAGFMRILSPKLCRTWHGKIINIHPSLLPQFKGLDTHKRALDAEATEHGCTVHFVTAGVDEGPIIGQVSVPVLYDDTTETLSARVLAAEHRLYPWALAEVASGRVSIATAYRA